MEYTRTLSDPDEIRRQCKQAAQVEKERYAPQAAQGFQDAPAPHGFNRSEIMNALNRNEDGDAWLYVEIHRHRFCYDTAEGCWYIWTGHYWKQDTLDEAMRSIDAVIAVYATLMETTAIEIHEEVMNGTRTIQ